ncbi:MAG: hypothetical protein JXA15_12905 [Spirochaetales bacterium]|nr:hypothetical protein [Spirochaetales bacterium]
MSRRIVVARLGPLLLALLLAGLAQAGAQAAPADAPSGTPIPAVALPALAEDPAAADPEGPEPYTEGEFPRWLRELGRFETIAVGAFPLMYFYSGVGFDLYRFTANGFDAFYAPWPFKGPASYQPTDEDRNIRLATALGLSAGVAAVDLLIRTLRD